MLMTEKQYKFLQSTGKIAILFKLGLNIETITKEQASDMISKHIKDAREKPRFNPDYINEWALTNGYL